MLIKESAVFVADNSGALLAQVIDVYGKAFASIGDVVRVSVKKCVPNSKVKKGDVFLAVVVRTKSLVTRSDGFGVKFTDNAVVLIKQDGTMVGTAVFGPVGEEVRASFLKITSLARDVV